MIARDGFKVTDGVGEHINGSGVGSCWMGTNTANDGGKGFDGAKKRVEGTMHGDVFISFVILLEDESDGDGICCVKFRMVMREFVTMEKETEIMKGKCFCSSLLTC